MDVAYCSRTMPARLERRLLELAEKPMWLDGRSADLMGELLRLDWVERDQQGENPRSFLYRLTPHGKRALERHRRGVDPYLRMTG
jgi:DNA-binding MarR family transcriptional regulator